MKAWHQEKNAPQPGSYLCARADIPMDGVVEFSFGLQPKNMFRMFIYNHSGELRAYMNVCPHFDVPLNVRPGEMFTSDRSQFMCAIHYAKFNLHDGHCTEGPCEGVGLESIPLRVEGHDVFIGEIASPPP